MVSPTKAALSHTNAICAANPATAAVLGYTTNDTPRIIFPSILRSFKVLFTKSS